jgi:hypothetical protein
MRGHAPFPLPGLFAPEVVARPQGAGPGFWAGAAAVTPHPDGGFVIAYRVRNGHGGVDENVIARSADGVELDEVARFAATRFGGRWVERPAIVVLPDGGWRLYACWGGPQNTAWSIAVIDSPTLAGLASAPFTTTLERDPLTAVKDPIVVRDGDAWRAWVCCHPLDEPGEEDRMSSAFATSRDGLEWEWEGTVLAGTPDHWDARGARLTAVLPDGRASYDGRRSAEENWFERTGIAHLDGEVYRASGGPVADVRYLTIAELPGGAHRIWYEARLDDETHELWSELVPAF